MSKAKKLYGLVFGSIETKNPQNAGNIKNTVDDIPRDFTRGTDFCADVTAHEIGHPNKKTRVLE